MIRIVGLMSLLCALLALAVRQQVDVQEMSFQIRLNTSDNRQASKAQVTVRHQQAISGHTSLNTMNVYSIQAVDGECRDVIKKVSDLAKEQLAAGRSIDEDVDKAFLRDSSDRGRQELSEAFAVLDRSDLRDVLNTGEIWSLRDQDILIRCETNQSIRIEEETQTASGEELIQGDLLVPSDDSWSFLQMTKLITQEARWAGKTWPTNTQGETIVFYCYDPGLDDGAKTAFRAAIEHTSSQVPCLRFVDVGYNDGNPGPRPPLLGLGLRPWQKTKGDRGSCLLVPSVRVQNTDYERCWSHVGMHEALRDEDSSQPLNLGYPCQTMAVAAHELGHTLGMLHEQSRTDRDDYITVHWDNIAKGTETNFEMQIESWQSQIYDPLSLMHYEAKAFAEDTARPTITANNPKVTALLGQRQGWSEQDVLELHGRYCSGKVEPLPAVRQQAILERLVGQDFKPVMKFSQLLVPSSTPSFCVHFEPIPQEWKDKPEWKVQGCDVNSGLRTGFCQYMYIQNVCSNRVRIACPHEVPGKPMILNYKRSALQVYDYLKDYDDHSTRTGGTRWVNEAWKELEMGLCGVYVEP